jgi:hypothetical protein
VRARLRGRGRLLVALGLGLTLGGGALLAQTPGFVGLKLLANGNLGVNTATPEQPLHVSGDALITGLIRGRHPSGLYGDAAVIRGVAASQTAATGFVLFYDDSVPNKVPVIKVLNPATGIFKTFIVGHPTDPKRYLVHATLEGPEGAVYYRGSARLEKGRAEIVLPSYFEAFTRPEDRTVLLTAVDGFDPIAVVSRKGARIRDGRFTVESSNRRSIQAFDWEVKAVRADGARLAAEPLREDIAVAGAGPYTYVAARR